ncbi:hypothetical protein PVK06_025004 [Gossypium arboreum]|uniref:Uncharacterized protein n=1 Tax=Gossypium arboreum TaxID=29729 RepID=A0ABR0PF76_GOSAR|nr:hypothetical protein PVK06_025004 [Gossypium arboreum]
MTLTPLLNILTENKLNKNNYNKWKRNLIIVLSYEELKTVLDNRCPQAIQAKAQKQWEEVDEIAYCYMLASMTGTLHEQLETCKTVKAFLDKLQDIFGGQATLAQ